MGFRIGAAVVCLHMIAVVCLLPGVMLLLLFTGPDARASWPDDAARELTFAAACLLFCLVMSAGIEFVVYGLHRRKHWAWVAGLCVFGLCLPSPLVPLSALGFWGLLNRGSLKQFGVTAGTHPV